MGTAMSVARILLPLLLLVCQSLSIEQCIPRYDVENINILLDTWRLRTRDGWHTENADPRYSTTWTSGGECEESTLTVCTADSGKKLIKTPITSKTLPAPDLYPVNIFINITYSFGGCPKPKRSCDESFEVLISKVLNSSETAYSGQKIMPNNEISSENDASSGTKQFSFEMNDEVIGFILALRVGLDGGCVTVSRILVYNYECPGHDKYNTGLLRRPATQAPASGVVDVMSYCTDNSKSSEHSKHDTLQCTSEGDWINELGHCECNSGYKEVDDACIVLQPTTTSISEDEGVDSTSAPYQTSTTDQPSSSSLPNSEDPNVASSAEGNEKSGSSMAMIGGVVVLIIVILALVVVVVVLILVMVRRKKKNLKPKSTEPDQQLTNPVYDAVSQNIQMKMHSTTGNGTSHNQDGEDTVRNFKNPLYHLRQASVSSKGRQGNENHYFEDPQYSIVHGNGSTSAEYEVPVASPTSTSPPLPPLPPPSHVYDYAALPPGVAPEYATLEPTPHAYHTLEFPTNGPATSSKKENGTVGGEGGGRKEGSLDEPEYSVLGQK